MFHGRADAETCSPTCYQRVYRRRHGVKLRPKHQRDVLDRYYTDDRDAERCVAVIRPWLPRKGYIVEPSVGAGAFVHALRQVTKLPILGVDVDHTAPALRGGWDNQIPWDDLTEEGRARALAHRPHLGVWAEWVSWRPIDLHVAAVVGNPPYNEALEHVEHALELAQGGLVAMLLPLAFRTSRKRSTFWRTYPAPVTRAFEDRPSFTGDNKTDSRDYALYVWGDHVPPEHGMGKV